ncbi:hypothetical protein Unana1_06631 [Umbelopsis nana]
MLETTWTHQQRQSIHTIVQIALTRLHDQQLMDDQWVANLWHHIARHYHTNVSAEKPCSNIILCFTKPEDVRFQVLLDLLTIILDLQTDTKEAKDIDMTYDARDRQLLLEVANIIQLSAADVEMAERSVGQEIYFKLEERGVASADQGRTTEMGERALTAMEDASKKNRAWRWVKLGAGAAAGGAVIALTGGLAAPLVAPLVVGLTGATFFTTAGGIALMTSLFGLTGGGLTGWKMHRRTRGIEDFQFEQLMEPNLPHIPSLHCTICISGYLLDDSSLCTTPWETAFHRSKAYQDIYCVNYEKTALLNLGSAFKSFFRNEAFKYAGKEALKMTALQAFFAAVALPATLLKAADVIDNPWQIASDRSIKAGIGKAYYPKFEDCGVFKTKSTGVTSTLVLADVLEQRVQGKRPCTLIGFSVGSLVITECLKELAKRDQKGIVDNVVLMGAPISSYNAIPWNAMASVVSNRFVNCYSPNDWVLATVYRLHSMSTEVAGLSPVKNVSRIENVQVDVEGHSGYSDKVPAILYQIGIW